MSSFLQDSLERFLCKQGFYSLVEDNRPTVLDSTLSTILQNPTIIVNKITYLQRVEKESDFRNTIIGFLNKRQRRTSLLSHLGTST